MLEALLRARKFQGSKLRLNVARGAPTEKHPSGRVMLKDAVLSDVVKSGRLCNAVRKYHPWVEQLTLNKNLCCSRHVDRNEGTSLIAFFGDFTGGGLLSKSPTAWTPMARRVCASSTFRAKAFGSSTTAGTHIGPSPSRASGTRLWRTGSRKRPQPRSPFQLLRAPWNARALLYCSARTFWAAVPRVGTTRLLEPGGGSSFRPLTS